MAAPNHQLTPPPVTPSPSAAQGDVLAVPERQTDPVPDFTAVFEAATTAQAVLSTSFDFLAVNSAFARLVRCRSEDLLGRNVFDVFSGNAGDDLDNGPARLRASLERVVATREPDDMLIQRYDLADPDRPELFTARYWSPVNSPVRDADGVVTAVLHRVEDVTSHRRYLLKAMQRFRAAVGESDVPAWDRRFVEFMTVAMDGHVSTRAAQQEVEQLKEALAGRADIDQAKGILMATHRCDAETAFQILVKMSNNGNIKLRDVVAAILYKTVQPSS